MSRAGWGVAIGVGVLGGAALAFLALRGGVSRALAPNGDEPNPLATPPTRIVPAERPFSTLDVEAAARMLASENPRGSEQLHVEQIWTQLRSKRRNQTLFDRITNGSGWGEQGDRRPGGGGVRPVSTEQPATPKFRDLAVLVLLGKKTSRLPGAKKFFEPAVQDAVFKIAEAARQKLRLGQKLDKREKRLINYRKTAADVRRDWLKKSLFLDTIEGVEFYT